MNWKWFRQLPVIDTRAFFVASSPKGCNLLDIGSSDGQSITHFNELRPDIRIFATDIHCQANHYPEGTLFHQCDIQKDKLPWPDRSFERITCMHVVEHLSDFDNLFVECERLLKHEGRLYIETPHPKSLTLPSPSSKLPGGFTLNFYDDPTHKQIVTIDRLADYGKKCGLKVIRSGISRNWLFASLYVLFGFFPPSRKKYITYVHFKGWSSYIIFQKQP